MLDDQIFYLVFNATFSHIVIKYVIWILTPLSVISCSNILFGFNVTFIYTVIKDFILCLTSHLFGF